MKLRERTTIPRTMPKFLTIRYPGSSTADVTIPASTRGIFILLGTDVYRWELPARCWGALGGGRHSWGHLSRIAGRTPAQNGVRSPSGCGKRGKGLDRIM